MFFLRRLFSSTPAASATSTAAFPPDASTAVITGLQELSPTVRGLHLRVESRPAQEPFRFRAGQWVDFFVNGLDKVGGFSMVSAPEDLPVLRLAVKKADFAPPARWVHHEARVGDRVAVKAGGSFALDMTSSPGFENRHLVLVAGGVGVNPVFSILLHVDRWLSRGKEGGVGRAVPPIGPDFQVSFLYSATTAQELVFRDEIEEVAARHPEHVRTVFICTRDEAWEGRRERIDAGLLRQVIVPGSEARTTVMVCGPPVMIDALDEACDKQLRTQVLFEKWW